MKLFKQDLLTLLISLFIFTGCQNPDGIGLEVDPENAIEGKLIDSLTILSATVKEDSVSTKSLTKYPLGYFNDPVLGPTDAGLYASLTLPTDNLTFGTTPTLDSAVLVLRYADEYAGDVNSYLNVEVYQLASRLTVNSNYFSTAEHLANPDLITSKSVKVNLKDSIGVVDIVKGKPDVNKKNAPQLRIPIPASFILPNFLNAAATNFKDNNVFNDFIKGLHLKVNQNQTTGAGGIALFDLANTDSRLELYYKSTNGTVADSNVTSFNFNTAFTAASIRHDYAGTAVETQLNAPATTYNVNFIQPLGGVKTRLTFPYVQNLKALGDITINKAELVVQVETGTDIFAPAPRLFLYRTDIAEQRQLMPDVILGLSDISLGGFYDIPKKQYKFALTAYIQDILSGKLTQYNTFITAIDSKANSTAGLLPSATTASRVVIGSGSKTAPLKMKLNVIYTKVK